MSLLNVQLKGQHPLEFWSMLQQSFAVFVAVEMNLQDKIPNMKIHAPQNQWQGASGHERLSGRSHESIQCSSAKPRWPPAAASSRIGA